MKNKFGNLLAADFYKLSKLKSIYISGALMLLLVLLQYVVFWVLEIPIGMNSSFNLFEPNGKNMLLNTSSYISLAFFMAIICTIFIAGDFSHGTMKNLVARGGSRVQIFFSKWLTITILVLFYTLLCILFSGILSSVKGYGLEFNALEFGIIVRSIVLQCLINISVGSIFTTIAFLFRKQGASLAISLVIFVLALIFSGIILAFIISKNNLDLMYLYHIVPSKLLNLATEPNANYEKIGELMEVIFLPITYILISWLISLSSFLNKDVK